MARFEGSIKVTGYLSVVVDEPGMTLKRAKAEVERYPESYKCLFVEDLSFEEWEDSLQQTETDEPEDE